jgi:psiF repeat
MNVTKYLAALVFAASFATGVNAAEAAKPASAKIHTPESIECTKEADAKGLHGKERKAFRSECKKNLMAHKPATASTETVKPAAKPVMKPMAAKPAPAGAAATKAN